MLVDHLTQKPSRPTGLLLGILVLTLPGSSKAADLYIDAGGGADFTTIQDAIDTAGNGDQLHIAAGTYSEDLDTLGKELSLLGEPGVRVEGIGLGPVLKVVGGEPAGTSIDGVELVGGMGEEDLYGNSQGGTILVLGGSLKLQNVTVSMGTADYGGGIAVLYGSLTMEDSVVSGCTAQYGGGLYSRDSFLTLRRTQVHTNLAIVGAGIRSYDGTLDLQASRITSNGDNTSISGGLALRYLNSTSRIINTTVLDNEGQAAGGLHLDGSSPTISNNLIVSNEGPGIVVEADTASSPTFTYNAVSHNLGDDWMGISAPLGADGSVDTAPLFVSYSDNQNPTDDVLFLLPGGAGWNTGDPSLLDADGTRSDMGAFGGPFAPLVVLEDNDADGLADLWEELYGLDSTQNDANEDTDNDGLTHQQEYMNGTSPISADTDGDGVSDGAEVGSGQDPLSAADNLPVARAGSDDTMILGSLILLDGSASADPNGDILSFQWRVVSVPSDSTLPEGVLSQTKTITVLPDVEGSYTFGLTVHDGKVSSHEDMVTISVRDSLKVPTEFATIQEAIDNAINGDTILVASGTYRENLRVVDVHVTLRSELGADFTSLVAEDPYDPLIFVGESSQSTSLVLEGFTLDGEAMSARAGGIVGWISDITLTDNVFTELYGYYGGAVYLDGGSLLADGNHFVGNQAETGGAIYLGAEGVVTNNIFTSNTACTSAAVRVDGTYTLQLFNNSFIDTAAGCEGTFIVSLWSYSRTSEVINNTFVGSGSGIGAEIYIGESVPDIRNNILMAGLALYGIYSEGYVNPDTDDVAYNTIFGYSLAASYGLNEVEMRNGNLTEDPLLLGYSMDGDAGNDDLHPGQGSPSIDAGDPAVAFQDVDGSRNDQGTYGGPLAEQVIDLDGDSMDDSWEIRYGLNPGIDDGSEDNDADGLTNLEEYQLYTIPTLADTDQDGWTDGEEVDAGTNPRNGSDHRPVANAGADVGIWLEDAEVIVDGALSTDPDGDSLSYSWRFSLVPDESTLTDSDILAEGSVAQFTADSRGTYVLRLTVSDGRSSSPEDEVVVSVFGTLRVPGDYPTIQEAIDHANPGERILVAAGDYPEELFLNKPLHLESEAGADETFIMPAYDEARLLLIYNEGQEPVVITGFTFTGAKAWNSGAALALGLGALTVKESRFIGNSSEYQAGAILATDYFTDLTLIDTRFEQNVASDNGGALVAYSWLSNGATVNITRCHFVENRSTYGLGAVNLSSVDAIISNTVFEMNQGGPGGALRANDYVDLTLDNNIFTQNRGDMWADVGVSYSPSFEARNNIFLAGLGASVVTDSVDEVDFSYNDVKGYLVAYGGDLFPLPDAGNISEVPRFESWTFNHDPSDEDFHLRRMSPAINSGDPLILDADGSRSDMGIYGGPLAAQD